MNQLKTFFLLIGLFSLSTTPLLQAQRAYLGVYSENVSPQKANLLNFENRYGSYVTKIIPGTAAEEAGLQPLDYIYAINGVEADWTTSLSDMLSRFDAGDQATLSIIRKGSKKQLKVTFKSHQDRAQFVSNDGEDPFFGVSSHNSNSETEIGVRINVVGGSTADEIGLRDGDILLSINGHTMIDWTDISGAINSLEPRAIISVTVDRNGVLLDKSGPIRSKAVTEAKRKDYEQKERAFLGIYSSDVSRNKAIELGFDTPYGSYVTSVFQNSAAERAGLQAFDYIFGIDEYRVGSDQSLTNIIRKYRSGEQATLHFIRNGKVQTASITFGSRDEARSSSKGDCEDPFLGIQHADRSSSKGVRINPIRNSTAMEMGLKDNDVVIAINDFPIIDWEDVSTAIDNSTVGSNIKVTYLRDGIEQTAQGALKSNCETRSGSHNYNYNYNYDHRGKEDIPQPALAFRDGPEVSLQSAKVQMQEMETEEYLRIEEDFGLEIPRDNNLPAESLRLFPNPNTGMFTLQFELTSQGETLIQIFNSAGRRIYEYELENFSGDFSDEVDISQNGAGTYFLLITQGDQSISRKVVITE